MYSYKEIVDLKTFIYMIFVQVYINANSVTPIFENYPLAIWLHIGVFFRL